MLQSMTGYGKAEKETSNSRISVEIRSLNSKGLDLSVYLPKRYSDKELGLRKELNKRIQRGKANVSVRIEALNGKSEPSDLNIDVAAKYIAQFKTLASKTGVNIEPFLSQIPRLPEVLSNDKDADENEWKTTIKAIDHAISDFEAFRLDEGRSIESDLLNSVSVIIDLLARVEPFEQERVDSIRSRILNNLEKHSGVRDKVNADRFEQEMIYYIEKLDINEERSRLRQHCSFFIDSLKQASGNGRKLGFIAQEMGREINTLGSKANHVEMQKIVVEMKEYLDKIKEQILNVL